MLQAFLHTEGQTDGKTKPTWIKFYIKLKQTTGKADRRTDIQEKSTNEWKKKNRKNLIEFNWKFNSIRCFGIFVGVEENKQTNRLTNQT